MTYPIDFHRLTFPQMTLPNNLAIDWPTVLQQHKPWLQKVLRSRVGDSHEIEDLFQEIALAVFRQSKTQRRSDGSVKPATVPSNPEKVAPWLYRLAVRRQLIFTGEQIENHKPNLWRSWTHIRTRRSRLIGCFEKNNKQTCNVPLVSFGPRNVRFWL